MTKEMQRTFHEVLLTLKAKYGVPSVIVNRAFVNKQCPSDTGLARHKDEKTDWSFSCHLRTKDCVGGGLVFLDPPTSEVHFVSGEALTFHGAEIPHKTLDLSRGIDYTIVMFGHYSKLCTRRDRFPKLGKKFVMWPKASVIAQKLKFCGKLF